MNLSNARKNGFRFIHLAGALLLNAAAGCAPGVEASPGGNVSSPLSLAGPVHVTATSAVATGSLDVTVIGGVGPSHAAMTLPLTSAQVTVQTTATWAGVTELRLPIGDLSVSPPAMPPSGLQLRDLVLGLHSTTPVGGQVVASSDDVLDVSTTTTLALNWKLVTGDGTVEPLGALLTTPLSLSTDVVRDANGVLMLHVHGSCPGTCGGVNGIVAMENAVFDITVPATATARAE